MEAAGGIGSPADGATAVGEGVLNGLVSSMTAKKSSPPRFGVAYDPVVNPAKTILPSEPADIPRI